MPKNQGKPGRPPKRGAVVAGGMAIDRLRPEDQARVRSRVADFLRYVRWQRVMEEDGLIRVYE